MSKPPEDERELTAGAVRAQTLDPSGNPVNDSTSVSGLSRFHSRQKAAVDSVPIVHGFRACRDFYHRGSTIRTGSGLCGTYLGAYKQLVSGDICDYDPGFAPLPGPNMQNASLVKALNKVKDQRVHLGVLIAEAKQSAYLIGDTFYRFARAVTSFRRQYPRDFEKAMKLQGHLRRKYWCQLPRNYLELQYGWRPAMQDVQGVISHLADRSRFLVPYITGEATVASYTTWSSLVNGRGGTRTMELGGKWGVRTFLTFGVDSPELAEWSSLGIPDAASIIWEKRPYSFIVDWCVPVGSWLSAIQAGWGLAFKCGGQTRFHKGSPLSISKTNDWSTWVDRPPDVGGAYFNVNRTCFAGTPFPGLYVKSPISVEHAMNGLALLQQAFQR